MVKIAAPSASVPEPTAAPTSSPTTIIEEPSVLNPRISRELLNAERRNNAPREWFNRDDFYRRVGDQASKILEAIHLKK